MPNIEQYKAIGLMSGTSLDGLDMVYSAFELVDKKWTYSILDSKVIAYDDDWQRRLAEAINLSPIELEKLDEEYGLWLGNQATEFIEEKEIKVDLISSHGHTIFHEPDKGITLQIGDGQMLANETGVKTICDFRSLDVELGGQGAPLVPIGDKLLFSKYSACLNLGGIANISYDTLGEERIAFDIGMANMPLNHLVKEIGFQYDKDGLLSRKGKVNEQLFSDLNSLEYFKLAAPKSLGIEWFIQSMLPILDSYEIIMEDKLATLIEHEAFQIGQVLSSISQSEEMLVTGGGANNKFLIERIQHYSPSKTNIRIPELELIEFKEALIFGLMGVLRIRGEINCLKSVTGAMRDSSSGKIFDPQH